MAALDYLHTFAISDAADGGNLVEVFRRVDLHRLRKVATILVPRVGADIDSIGETICREFDRQLEAKAAAGGAS